ncbi:MAG: hypothetical protein JXA82_13895 [Sedimentisphaerales bacterium]|nr:hypothetical protein [Sedimentisphaerales bacterium]
MDRSYPQDYTLWSLSFQTCEFLFQVPENIQYLTYPDGTEVQDLFYLAERWLNSGDATILGAADVNGDGKVSLVDLRILSENWQTLPSP